MSTSTSGDPASIRVLFVCMGNICRSPMAHAVLEDMVRPALTPSSSLYAPPSSSSSFPDTAAAAAAAATTTSTTFHVDSAGTGAWHVGDAPDGRTLHTLDKHGVRGFRHAARKVRTADFADFDYVLAMDDDNLDDLRGLRRRAARELGDGEGGGGGTKLAKLAMFGEYGGRNKKGAEGEVIVDPYYGSGDGFEVAYEQCVRFSKAFLEDTLGKEWEGKVGRTKM